MAPVAHLKRNKAKEVFWQMDIAHAVTDTAFPTDTITKCLAAVKKVARSVYVDDACCIAYLALDDFLHTQRVDVAARKQLVTRLVLVKSYAYLALQFVNVVYHKFCF